MLCYVVLHVSKSVDLLSIPTIMSAHFQAKPKKEKKVKARLVYIPGYFVHITALQYATTSNLAVVTHNLTL